MSRSPLTTNRKRAPPSASAEVSSCTWRNPTCREVRSTMCPPNVRTRSSRYSGWSPCPAGHQRRTESASSETSVEASSAGCVAVATTSPSGDISTASMIARARAACASPTCSSSISTSTRAPSPSTGLAEPSTGVGRTAANLDPCQRSNAIGLQMPAVVSCGPQSQPKLHAILRMKL